MNEVISASDNSSVAAVDNQETGPAIASSETGANGGQAQGATPTQDLFRGIDPNKLPPEVKGHYDSMLRDYREKTAKLSEATKSEVAKAVESYKQRAELYDQIATQEEFVKQWNDYVQKTQGQQDVNSNTDPVSAQVKAELNEIKQQLQMKEMVEVTQSFAQAKNEKGEMIHPDFDDLNQLVVGHVKNGDKAESYSLLRLSVQLASGATPLERLSNGYKAAKAVRDSIFEAGKKAGMGRLQTKIMNATNPPSNSIGENLSVTEKKPKNAREALEMAKKGVVVSRD